ncbi:uncharacterized protein LOC143818449 [Ranitomeya variabilis]|uniref:uncharacterized protein LOC143818449 n=1 Tax=Ranitomeya variabilis TaxID=490064 RepID=UPI0040561951
MYKTFALFSNRLSVIIVMDLRARETTWRSKATDLFKQGASSVSQDFIVENRDLSLQYRNALHRKTKLWWNKATLENYLVQSIVPRGLRVQVYPSFELEDPELTQRWCKAAITCSLEFIKIIIDKNNMSITTLDADIEELHKNIKKQLPADKMENFIKNIEKDMDKWENEISALKVKKFARDTADFETEKIFKWQLPKKKLRMDGAKYTGSEREQASLTENSTSGSEAESSNEYHMRTRTGARENREGRKYPVFFSNRKVDRRQNDKPKVINLSNHVLSDAQLKLLEKGLTFSPSSRLDKFQVVKDVHLFARKVLLQRLHYKSDVGNLDYSDSELEVLKNLEELLKENEMDDEGPL